MMREMRLNKYISASGFCSRRKADEWIASGSVLVNGKPADIGMQVKEGDTVTINGKEIRLDEPFKLVVFYKPKGYACTSHRGDKSGIFSNFNLDSDLRYVGRLDKDSEGLLLLTNDGNLCNDISRAANGHEKEYVVTVDREMTPSIYDAMEQGVPILDTMTRPCVITQRGKRTFHITITQGLNRQIRRMCEYFGYHVRSLKRIRVMNIRLDDLPEGKWRNLTEEELSELKNECIDRGQRSLGNGVLK